MSHLTAVFLACVIFISPTAAFANEEDLSQGEELSDRGRDDRSDPFHGDERARQVFYNEISVTLENTDKLHNQADYWEYVAQEGYRHKSEGDEQDQGKARGIMFAMEDFRGAKEDVIFLYQRTENLQARVDGRDIDAGDLAEHRALNYKVFDRICKRLHKGIDQLRSNGLEKMGEKSASKLDQLRQICENRGTPEQPASPKPKHR